MAQYDAASEGNLALVQQLVTEDNVDEGDENDEWTRTVLHYACEEGHYEVVAWLVGLGANVNVLDSDGETPLHWAADAKHSRCVKLLLEAGADAGIADNYGRLPLDRAYLSAECTALLIAAHPAGVNAVENDGATRLHFATRDGTRDVCSLLLEAGSVVDAVDNYRHTPLYWALRKGKRDVAELLLDRGAQLERVKLDEAKSYQPLTSIPNWAVSFVARRNACRLSCWAMLELARRRSRILSGNARDVLGIVARLVWDSRREESWKRCQILPKQWWTWWNG